MGCDVARLEYFALFQSGQIFPPLSKWLQMSDVKKKMKQLKHFAMYRGGQAVKETNIK